MEFDKVYSVKKEIDKDQFLRNLIIQLSNSPDTPIGIAKSQFGEVKESVKEVLLCSAHVELDYSASVGYDRQETYYSGNVKKTRTVTDWRPYSGHINGDEACLAYNEAYNDGEPRSGYKEHSELRKVILSIADKDIVEKGEAQISPDGLETAKETCKFLVRSDIRYPGDRHRDERCHGSVNVSEVVCYKLPFYEVDYIYEGETYHATGFACNESNLKAELPPNNVDIKAIAAKETKKDRTIMFSLWGAFAAFFVLAFALCAANVAYWLIVFPALIFAAAITYHVLYQRKFNARIRSLSEDNTELKLQEVQESLKEHNYDELTDKELDLFNTRRRAFSSEGKMGKKNRGKVVPIVVGAIGLAILLIMSIVMGIGARNRSLHSPEQFTIEITNKTQEYKPDVSPYINGCYYVYFDYQVTASTRIGATSMDITTHVSLNGEEIGTINSSLDGMNLDAGSSKSYQTYLQENQIERDDLFKTLYEADFSDLSFTFEITSISFSDGKWYSFRNW